MFAASHKLRVIRRLAVGVTALGILTSITVAPAFAALSDDGDISVGVTAGQLELLATEQPTFDPVPFQLSGTAQTTNDNFIYTVTDNTGNLTDGWTVSVVGEDLVSGANTIPVGNIVLTNVDLQSTAGDTVTGVTPASPVTMTTGSQPILTAVGGAGDGAYTHTVDVDVTVPNMTAAGTYTGTLVFTVAPETTP